MPAAIQADWGAIAAQAAAGATLEQLSEHWGIALGTLKDRCASQGWKRIARETRALLTGTEVVAPAHANGIQPYPVGPAISLKEVLGEKSKLRSARIGDGMLRTIQRKKGDDQLREVSRYAQVVSTLSTVHGWEAQSNTPTVTMQVLNQISVPPAIP